MRINGTCNERKAYEVEDYFETIKRIKENMVGQYMSAAREKYTKVMFVEVSNDGSMTDDEEDHN